jgi:hypothetical protein
MPPYVKSHLMSQPLQLLPLSGPCEGKLYAVFQQKINEIKGSLKGK